jgi:Asp/Glu/hydantoin racemase
LLDDFISAGKDLIRHGADGISTNCGFLALFQDELSAALAVPVATSSLMQVPFVERLLPPGKRVGIITISAPSLTAEHLKGAGVAPETPIVGTESGRHFSRAILNNEAELDIEASRLDLLDAGNSLLTQHEDIGAIVLECTNMVPYAADLRRKFGLPVYSIYTFLTWFQSGLLPRRFRPELDDTRL